MSLSRPKSALLSTFLRPSPCRRVEIARLYAPQCAIRVQHHSVLSVHSSSPPPNGTRALMPSSFSTSPTRNRSDQARTFSSSTCLSAAAAPPPGHKAALLASPSSDALAEMEVDIEPISPDEASISLTDRAAEQLQRISARQSNNGMALRIAVEAGGCHGYQYKLDVTDAASGRQNDDYLFSHPSIRPSNVVVDAVSLSLLKGSTVDFATALIGSAFQVLDNPQSKGAGCGCGVSWEAKF